MTATIQNQTYKIGSALVVGALLGGIHVALGGDFFSVALLMAAIVYGLVCLATAIRHQGWRRLAVCGSGAGFLIGGIISPDHVDEFVQGGLWGAILGMLSIYALQWVLHGFRQERMDT